MQSSSYLSVFIYSLVKLQISVYIWCIILFKGCIIHLILVSSNVCIFLSFFKKKYLDNIEKN